MSKVKFFIFLGSIISLIIFVVLFHNAVLFSNTLFEKQNGTFLINETFNSYELNSKVINSNLNNLSKWKDGGIITAWTLIENYEKVKRIDLILKDSENREIKINGIENLNISREANKIKSNDEFPDYNFKLCKNQSLITWEDFMLINGKNFLFWEWNETLDIDMENIILIEAVDGDKKIETFDIVIHDGLCKDINSLNGQWYSPNGLPQYGVWWAENSKLRMVNIEQEQYPSNGDHVRILSTQNTPKNFAMKVRFKVKSISPDYRKSQILKFFKETNRNNTFIRIAWDFDNVYDPGHDQTLLYISLEHGYLGLQRVYPIERYFKQGQEPSNREAKTKLDLKKDRTYEVDIFVMGQKTKATIYEIKSFYLKRVGEVEYIFEKPRPEKLYPFSIESTGNIEIELNSIEVKKIS